MKKRLVCNTLISTAVHVAIVAVLLVISIVSFHRTRPTPREITTFVELVPAIDSASSSPKSDEIPEPPKKEPKTPPTKKKRKIEVSKKQVKRTVSPDHHKLTRNDISKMLGKDAQLRIPFSADTELPFAWYLSRVRTIMYKAWQQPSALSGKSGLITRVMIRVQRDGQITQRKMIRSSGNVLMDTSVMNAVKSVNRIQELPAGFGNAHKDITIDFELAETSV